MKVLKQLWQKATNNPLIMMAIYQGIRGIIDPFFEKKGVPLQPAKTVENENENENKE